MRAIIDILKDNNMYTFMGVKEQLLIAIDDILSKTEYAGKYGLSGSFTSVDQTISVVVGLLKENDSETFISLGTGMYEYSSIPVLKEYMYGINVTSINDEEVRDISKYIYYELISRIPSINRSAMARLSPNIYVQPPTTNVTGEKRMWSINMFVTAMVSEVYRPRRYDTESPGNGLYAEGYTPTGYNSCVRTKNE